MNKFLIGLLIAGTGFTSCKSTEKTTEEPKSSYNISFTGQCHDPGWNVEIGPKTIVYTSMLNQEGYTFFDIERNPIMDAAGVGYSGTDGKGNKILVQVIKQPCRDLFMKKNWPFRVSVELDVTDGLEQGEMGLSGCGDYAEDKRLDGTWYVETFKGNPIPVINEDKTPIIGFDIAKNTINANMGCNGMGGTYELMENTIYIGKNFMSTLLYCEGAMELENNFSNAFAGKTVKYTFRNNKLILTKLDGEELVTLKHKK